MTVRSREYHLASRPVGWPTEDDFELVTIELPEPGDGEVLVRNDHLSVDPYMRGRMNDVKSYVPPYQIGEPMEGGAVGVVVASRAPELAEGDHVVHQLGWREYAHGPAKRFLKIDPELAPPPAYLGVLGTTGLTAYAGLVDVARLREGDTVFVSGAAGAVGSVAGQIAKLRGAARVVGSAGSPAKIEYLTGELGFDAAFNYKDGDVAARLAEVAPDGIDVYFDNVGGEQLEAAIRSMRLNGRIAMCGAIDQYNATSPAPGPRNLALFIGKRLTLRGFLVLDFGHLRPQFLTEVGGWLREGKLRADETIVEGFENMPSAFLGMLRGDNTGKMLVSR
ncbi:MAG: NADP-dependent oxidoreductase [Mycobacteriales bacterium]